MDSFYAETDKAALLQERIDELARIREGFAAHLGSSLYEVTKGDKNLRWGRESLYDGIAACDKERARLLERIEALEESTAGEQPKSKAGYGNHDEGLIEEQESSLLQSEAPEADARVTQEPVVDEPRTNATAWPEAEVRPGSEVAPKAEEKPVFDLWDNRTPAQDVDFTPVTEAGLEPWLESEPAMDSVEQVPCATAEPDELLCPNCGHPIRETDVFCMGCGASLANKATPHKEDEEASFDSSHGASQASVDDRCPVCGEPIHVGDKFCISCGTSLANSAASGKSPKQSKPSVCPSCGNPIDPSFKFCMVCGHKL